VLAPIFRPSQQDSGNRGAVDGDKRITAPRTGSSQTCRLDLGIVVATNQDLWRMVQERKFCADLYYRLNIFPSMLSLCANEVVTFAYSRPISSSA
jgi:hypothetical protein